MGLKIYLIFFIVILSLIQINVCQTQKEGCEYSKFEESINPLMGQMGFKENKWPENGRELSAWCKKWPKHKRIAKEYSYECKDGLSSTMASVIVYSCEKVNKIFCSNRKERMNYISRGKCGNAAKNETIKCWNDIINIASNLKDLQDTSDKIPTLCCAFFAWKNCTMEAFINNPSCNETVVELMEKHIDKASLDPLNFLCNDYDDSDQCDNYFPKFVRTEPPVKYRTFFPALFELFETL